MPALLGTRRLSSIAQNDYLSKPMAAVTSFSAGKEGKEKDAPEDAPE